MNTLYKKFFNLRDEYPGQVNLIAELMRFAFQNADTFPSPMYLNGNFEEKDVRFIFEKLDLPIVEKVIHTNLRSSTYTILHLK